MEHEIDIIVGDAETPNVTKAKGVDLVITCGRHPGIDIMRCHCPKDWLGNRELWIAAERELEKHRHIKLDVDKAKADLEEFMDAAHKDFAKLNAKNVLLQETLQDAISAMQRIIDGTSGFQTVREDIVHLKGILEASKVG